MGRWFESNLGSQKKLLEISQGVFSVIFAFGELYCSAVIFRLRLSDIALRAVKGEYNITETVRFQYHFHVVKISLCAKHRISLSLAPPPLLCYNTPKAVMT